MTRPHSLKHIFSTNIAQELALRVQQQIRLTTDLRSCLDAELAAHAQVAALHNDYLLILTSSAAWATRLRYQTPQLVRCLSQLPHFTQLRHIEVRVVPLTPSAPRSTQPPELSSSSATVIEASAKSVDHPPLRAALLRLARRGK